MKCFFCKGQMDNEHSIFAVDLDDCVIVVRKVPSHVCDRCGQTVFDDEVSRQLQHIVKSLRSSTDEINVVNYDAIA